MQLAPFVCRPVGLTDILCLLPYPVGRTAKMSFLEMKASRAVFCSALKEKDKCSWLSVSSKAKLNGRGPLAAAILAVYFSTPMAQRCL
ncbi:hypothetical protein P3578_24545, partial [Vibrio parahaemolyticus]|nr:hypothetical protein [Vibrio parahaemolyticus]